MGQGAESCNGYGVEYDPYDEGLAEGVWTCRDYSKIRVEDMTERHLRGAIRVATKAMLRANFSSDKEMWSDWVDVLQCELDSRESKPTVKKQSIPSPKKPQRGSKLVLICWCDKEYTARVADLKRGWGMSCCKSHAAIKRDYGRRNPIVKETGELLGDKL